MEETDRQNLKTLLIYMGLILVSTVLLAMFGPGLFGPCYQRYDLVQDPYNPQDGASVQYFDRNTNLYAYEWVIIKANGERQWVGGNMFMEKEQFERKYTVILNRAS